MKKGFLLGLLAAILAVVLVRSCCLSLVAIPGAGAGPELHQGDRLLVNRLAYGLRLPLSRLWGYHRWGTSTPRRNDWAVFNSPTDTPTLRPDTTRLCVGRCIALPGDTVWLGAHGKVSTRRNPASGQIWPLVVPAAGTYVRITPWNAQLYARTINRLNPGRAAVKGDSLYIQGRAVTFFRFQTNCYWMASGSTENLHDSRLMGFIPYPCLQGRATRVLYSLDGWRPRWKRTLHPLP